MRTQVVRELESMPLRSGTLRALTAVHTAAWIPSGRTQCHVRDQPL